MRVLRACAFRIAHSTHCYNITFVCQNVCVSKRLCQTSNLLMILPLPVAFFLFFKNTEAISDTVDKWSGRFLPPLVPASASFKAPTGVTRRQCQQMNQSVSFHNIIKKYVTNPWLLVFFFLANDTGSSSNAASS